MDKMIGKIVVIDNSNNFSIFRIKDKLVDRHHGEIYEFEKILTSDYLEKHWESCDAAPHKYWNTVDIVRCYKIISESELEDIILRTI